MRIAVFCGLLLLLSNAFAACDKRAAALSQENLRDLGTWSDKGNHVDFSWRPEMDGMLVQGRVQLMERIAQNDACLHPQARNMDFYLAGKFIGKVSADGIFRSVGPSFPLPPPYGLRAWFSLKVG